MIYNMQLGVVILAILLSTTGADQNSQTSTSIVLNSTLGSVQDNLSHQQLYCSTTTLAKCKQAEFMATDTWKLMCFNDTSVPPQTHLCSDVCDSNRRQNQLMCDDFCSGKYYVFLRESVNIL